jgi:transcription-repair coupling factor (superfamily II helicase)
MRDLEIRGAGNLLGAEQSGHIGAVGFDLYCRLLEEAVQELKEVDVERKPLREPPVVDLPLHAYIPRDYIEDLDMRLDIYQRLANVSNAKQVAEIGDELEDRFGKLPVPVVNLLYAVKMKVLAMDAGVASISAEDSQLVLRMVAGLKIDKEVLAGGLSIEGMKLGTSQLRLDIKRLGRKWQKTLEDVLQSLALSQAKLS